MSQFGGEPVDSGSQFGGQSVDPNAGVKITDPAAIANLTNLYFRAQRDVGPDSPQAKSIFNIMQQHGISVGAPQDMASLDAGAAKSTAQGQSFGQNAVAGFGKSFVDTGRGAQQLYAMAADKIDPLQQTTAGLVSGQQPTRSAAIQSTIDGDAAANSALNHTGGGIVGQGLGQGSQTLVPGSLLGKSAAVANLGWKGRLALQTAQGALQSGVQPVETGGNRLLNVAAGAGATGLGSVVGSAAGALANGFKNLDPVKSALANLADQYGIPTRLAQMSNSPLVQAVSSMANKMPGSGGQAANAAQKAAVNQAVSHTIGEDTNAITPDVYASARQRLSDTYNQLFDRNNVAVTPQLGRNMADISQQAARDLGNGSNEAQVVNNQIQRVIDASQQGKVPGAIDGRLYQTIRQDLKGMQTPDTQGSIIGKLRSALEDAANQSFSGADAAKLAETNQQWGNLKTIRDLVAKSDGSGISPQGLMGRVTANNYGKEAMARGNGGALGDLAKVSSGLLKDQIPDSGTPLRLLAGALLGGAAHTGGLGIIPSLATIGGGAALGRIINNPTLARLALNGSGPLGKNLALAARGLPFLAPSAAINATNQKTP